MMSNKEYNCKQTAIKRCQQKNSPKIKRPILEWLMPTVSINKKRKKNNRRSFPGFIFWLRVETFLLSMQKKIKILVSAMQTIDSLKHQIRTFEIKKNNCISKDQSFHLPKNIGKVDILFLSTFYITLFILTINQLTTIIINLKISFHRFKKAHKKSTAFNDWQQKRIFRNMSTRFLSQQIKNNK